MKISVIVSTYNRSDALARALESLAQQTDRDFEVIVADDGSGEETRQTIDGFQKNYPVSLIHAWQEDTGFRLSASRNNAVRHATGEYFVFMDGDCIALPDFVTQHRALAQKGCAVGGNRALLSEGYTKEIIAAPLTKEWLSSSLCAWYGRVKAKKINRILPFLRLPVMRMRRASDWKRLRGCNIGVWKTDYMNVGGFEEGFEGWGFEDSEFAVRLINSGVKIKNGAFAAGLLHLYHEEKKTGQEGPNWEQLQNCIKTHQTKAIRGI